MRFRFRNQLFGILSAIAAGIFLHMVKETSWAIFAERVLEEAAHKLHIERPAMIAALSQILILGGLLWALMYFAFRVGKAERPAPPDPAVEAARAHTEAIKAQTEAMLTGSLIKSEPQQRPPFDPAWTRDVSLIDAIWRAHVGRWNERIAYDREDWKVVGPFVRVVSDIRQKAFEGLLPVWGTRPRSNLYEPIPPDFWVNNAIEPSYAISPNVRETWVYVTKPLVVGEVPHARTTAWENFMTDRKVVEQWWPAKPGAPSRKITLMEAAQRAHDQTKGGWIERTATSKYSDVPDGVLTYYAYQLVRTIPLYGKLRTGKEYETIDDSALGQLILRIEDGRFILEHPDGSTALAYLAIAEADLPSGVKFLKSFDGLLNFLKDDGL